MKKILALMVLVSFILGIGNFSMAAEKPLEGFINLKKGKRCDSVTKGGIKIKVCATPR